MKFRELRKISAKDTPNLKSRKIAILADSTTQYFAQALKGIGIKSGYGCEIYEAPYNQINGEVYNTESGLYQSQPNYIILLYTVQDLKNRFYASDSKDRSDFVEKEIAGIKKTAEIISEQISDAKIFISTYAEMDDGISGNHSSVRKDSLLYTVRSVNSRIIDEFAGTSATVLDIQRLQSRVGYNRVFDDRLYYLSSSAFALDFLVEIAQTFFNIVNAFEGKPKKCLITDLDNTIWGGTVGDDGPMGIALRDVGVGKAFSDIQKWMKELTKRGIVLCVCSKNDEDKAKQPFIENPAMTLSLDDVAIFTANWEDKATNIRKMQMMLNISFDSMVFVDDNPFERSLVSKELPEVVVPDIPKDPVEILNYLQQADLFETTDISDEDKKRNAMYKQEAERSQKYEVASNLDEYLKGLDMKCTMKPFDDFSVPRVAQLAQRTNQFNLSVKRYTADEIKMMADDPTYITWAVSLEDSIGDSGIVAMVIIKQLNSAQYFIDSFIMSCRVFNRGLEEYIMNKVVETAKDAQVQQIFAEYVETDRNGLVGKCLTKFGFVENEDDQFELEVDKYKKQDTFVQGEDNG